MCSQCSLFTTFLLPLMDTMIPDISKFQFLSGSSTRFLSWQPSLACVLLYSLPQWTPFLIFRIFSLFQSLVPGPWQCHLWQITTAFIYGKPWWGIWIHTTTWMGSSCTIWLGSGLGCRCNHQRRTPIFFTNKFMSECWEPSSPGPMLCLSNPSLIPSLSPLCPKSSFCWVELSTSSTSCCCLSWILDGSSFTHCFVIIHYGPFSDHSIYLLFLLNLWTKMLLYGGPYLPSTINACSRAAPKESSKYKWIHHHPLSGVLLFINFVMFLKFIHI